MVVWQNPLQTKEERNRRIEELLAVETDPAVCHLLKLILQDEKGSVHVNEDGTLVHLVGKIRRN